MSSAGRVLLKTERSMSVRVLSRLLLCVALFAGLAMSTPSLHAADKRSKSSDSRDRSTAVALNYCRASFHRIRKTPSKRVMLEEQEKILNNLNLDGIADAAVIKLYTEVLDEIAQIEIAERETTVLQDKFKKTLHRKVGITAVTMAAQMATLSFERAVYSGVNSWLDYRDMNWTREFDTWKVEKTRINAVVDKSSRFLDTFWKLTQSRNIPDRWLVRGNDLDDLTAAVQEADLHKRLRILKRMEPYMECYPPYWYYVARTQQGLGELALAAETYDNLADLGHGHFRRDDMMAASLANLAVIQTFLKQPNAERTAREALAHSPDVWQANLMAAQVLEHHGYLKEAEDAILRNIDVDLETSRSTVALVGLYYRQHQADSLAKVLADEEILKSLPVLSLVQAAAELARTHPVPPATLQRLRTSLRVAVEPRFGADDLVIACNSVWQSGNAKVALVLPGHTKMSEAIRHTNIETHPSGETVIRFRGAINGGNPWRPTAPQLAGTSLIFTFPPSQVRIEPLIVLLGDPVRRAVLSDQATAPWWTAASPVEIRYGAVHLDLVNPMSGNPVTRPFRGSPVPGSVAQVEPSNDGGDGSPPPAPSPGSTQQKVAPDRHRPRITIIGVRVREAARDVKEPLQNSRPNTADPEILELPPPPPPES